jgi:stage V sporulation protein G
MNITDVSVKIIPNGGSLRASADVTIDNDFVIHQIRIIQLNERLIVAMPNRASQVRCPCGCRCPQDSKYCCCCGQSFSAPPAKREHSDIAHPITSSARERMNEMILKAYDEALKNAQAPVAAASSGLRVSV